MLIVLPDFGNGNSGESLGSKASNISQISKKAAASCVLKSSYKFQPIPHTADSSAGVRGATATTWQEAGAAADRRRLSMNLRYSDI